MMILFLMLFALIVTVTSARNRDPDMINGIEIAEFGWKDVQDGIENTVDAGKDKFKETVGATGWAALEKAAEGLLDTLNIKNEKKLIQDVIAYANNGTPIDVVLIRVVCNHRHMIKENIISKTCNDRILGPLIVIIPGVGPVCAFVWRYTPTLVKMEKTLYTKEMCIMLDQNKGLVENINSAGEQMVNKGMNALKNEANNKAQKFKNSVKGMADVGSRAYLEQGKRLGDKGLKRIQTKIRKG